MELVDTHCHLQFDKLRGRIGEVLADARTAGVTKMICVGTTLADSQDMIELASRHSNVWAAAGIHPHDAAAYVADEEADTKLAQLLAQPKIVAVGEIGLDFYKDYSSPGDQKKALSGQIKAALPSDLPFVFHVRDAWQDFWPIVDEYKVSRGVVHSFSAGLKELDEALNRGFFVSLNGIMTFSKDEAQLEAARRVPLDKLLLETDAPFLAPAGFRGQICEPKHLRTTAEFLSELRGENLEKLAKATTANAEELFGLKNG